jgi:hypothetical protein
MNKKNHFLMTVIVGAVLLALVPRAFAQLQDIQKPSLIENLKQKYRELKQWVEEKVVELKYKIHTLRPSVQQKQMKEKADESKAMMRQYMQESQQDQAQAERQWQDAKGQMNDLQRQQKMMMQGLPGR